MKRQILIWTLGVAALLGFAGCRDDLADGFNPDEIRLDGQVVSSVQTKADVEIGIDYDTQLTNPLKISLVRWDANGGNNSMVGKTPVEATLGNPVATDEWKRPITFGTPQYYRNRTDNVGFVGWYPRTAGWTSEGGSVIDNQGRMTYTIDGQTDVMVSDFQQGNFGTGIPALTFRHALCMYKIYAYYVDDDAKTQWGNLKQVTFQNLPEQLFVDWPEDITSGQEATFSYTQGEQYKEVHLFAQDAEGQELPVGTTDSETTYLGTVLGGVPAIKVLGIQIKTANKQGGNSVSIARNFKPGYTYHIYLKLSVRGVINAEVSVGKWKYDPDNEITIDENMVLLTDLSRYGTANSYIVSSANRGYCFDATVKGNGVNTLTRRDGTTIQLPDRDVDIASQIDRVEVYRTDAMVEVAEGGTMSLIDTEQRPTTEMITLLSDKLSDGKVKFWVNGFTDEAGKPLPGNYALKYKGNVKIAAYNAQNEIVWSWHIWITDKPQNQGYQNGTVAMDRNLGAVSASPVSPGDGYVNAMTVWAGLFYQWGRKDAIFRRTVDDAYDTEEFPMSIKASPVPVADAHKAPSTYFYDRTGNHWTTDTEVNDHFWGYISDREDIVKTLYDPCPPGYRVTGNAMWESQAEEMTVEKPDISNSGYYFHIGDYTKVYYPSTACVADGQVYQDDLGGTEANNYVFQLSATPGVVDGTAYHFRYEQSAYQKPPNGTFETLVSDPTYHTKRSAAYPVRCVFEESGPVVTDLSAVQTANSYIIRRSGYYKFKANVRGNGVTSLQTVTNQSTGETELVHFDDGLDQTIAASEMGKADVLWWQGDLTAGSEYLTFANGPESNTAANVEARCPVRMLDNGQVYDNEIMFYADVREGGNVGIALYNRSGVILWTWHIWIVPEGVRGKQFGDYILMDRNLGATYAPAEAGNVTSYNALATYGFYYQWGRKDPMFGPRTYNEATNSTTRSTWFWKNNGTWEKKTEQLAEQEDKTIRFSVQNPLNSLFSDKYFNLDGKNGAFWWQTTYTYVSEGNPQVRNLWGYTGAASHGNSFAKTMWDPCPPGYRVMDHTVFGSINGVKPDDGYQYDIAGGTAGNEFGLLLRTGLTTGTVTGGSQGTGSDISADNVWFPYAGSSYKKQGWFDVGTRGHYFSASPQNKGKFGRSFECWGNGTAYIKHKLEDDQQQFHPVRCVME